MILCIIAPRGAASAIRHFWEVQYQYTDVIVLSRRQKAATYTLCGGDVHVAADEGQTVVHAHLEINHPEKTQHTQNK